jgi:hypothetical protein
MKYLLKASLIVCAIALAQPATAQDEGPPVPVEKAAYHWPVFRNDYMMVLRVNFGPGKGAGYHIHALDQISIIVEDSENAGQLLGEAPTPGRRNTRGSVGFTAFSKKPMTHKTMNVGNTPFQNIVIGLLKPEPGNFAPDARDVAGYTQLFDNERARAWRLVLEPGQTAGAITQKAPGLRVVVDGGEIAEIIQGEPDRGQLLRLGDFYWQEPGATRAVRNIGATRVNIVEIEIK